MVKGSGSPRIGTSTPIMFGIIVPLLALTGLYIFSASFFLAKRSMPHSSRCDEARALLHDTLGLSEDEISRIQGVLSSGSGCWMDRRVDSLVILVVDALRFDFARHHLPMSVGARISGSRNASSQLLQFVADPPTVTMQRLKGLTTGGLPTFADISASFGGATVDEDTWIQQLKDTPPSNRGYPTAQLAFVGDDTWIDLFPSQFDDSHPFPSFNTRDLDTVDNGCIEHLPRLLRHIRRDGSDGFELIVAHFLGVDHVGHTYGPHNQHMADKLSQMDAALSAVLDLLDESKHTCHGALVFGDHGMTEEGNHGGGTQDEINAALFAHFSPGCGDMSHSLDISGIEAGTESERAFQSIHQIDLVPTISILLGVPIPYANIGGLVPSLLPMPLQRRTAAPFTAAALALNAAQVWRYFTEYSSSANRLPSLPALEGLLRDAVLTYQSALEHANESDSMAYREACGKFKLFLTEAGELGKRVWTRFDTVGMTLGGSILLLTLAMAMPIWNRSTVVKTTSHNRRFPEAWLTGFLMFFQCVLTTFSNSYIEAERGTTMFALSVICISIFCRKRVEFADLLQHKNLEITPAALDGEHRLLLLIPCLSRLAELLVSGHGLDPSIPLHPAHNSVIFLSSLIALMAIRFHIYRKGLAASDLHVIFDQFSFVLIAVSWWEKRSSEITRNGYFTCYVALILVASGIIFSIFCAIFGKHPGRVTSWLQDFSITLLSKLLIGIMAVTGPSTSTSVLLLIVQSCCLYHLSGSRSGNEWTVATPVLAGLFRLVIRHVFFATNHSCAFNRLQYSAAFVASNEFNYVTGGISLFVNTFGWEMVGLIVVPCVATSKSRPSLWRWYCFYQWLETFSSCISVSLMRRHLMVWAIFAPRFLFAAIFMVLNAATQALMALLSWHLAFLASDGEELKSYL